MALIGRSFAYLYSQIRLVFAVVAFLALPALALAQSQTPAIQAAPGPVSGSSASAAPDTATLLRELEAMKQRITEIETELKARGSAPAAPAAAPAAASSATALPAAKAPLAPAAPASGAPPAVTSAPALVPATSLAATQTPAIRPPSIR